MADPNKALPAMEVDRRSKAVPDRNKGKQLTLEQAGMVPQSKKLPDGHPWDETDPAWEKKLILCATEIQLTRQIASYLRGTWKLWISGTVHNEEPLKFGAILYRLKSL